MAASPPASETEGDARGEPVTADGFTVHAAAAARARERDRIKGPPMLRGRIATTLLLLLVSTLLPGFGRAGDASLQARVERVLGEERLVGIGWALVDETDGITVGAAGLRDNRNGIPFAADTRFHVGSLTKTLLATGVLRLVTEGRIDLDAPVLDYLPDLFQGAPPAGFSDISVRHLLDHTAGLNDSDLWQMFSERPGPDDPLMTAFPDPHGQLQVRSAPGSRFSYSNMGYALLGMLIEAVVGERYEAYLDANLLAPLAMHDSTFSFTTQAGDNPDPTLAWGHVDDGSQYAASPIFLRPAGQFTTTTADLGRFAQFLLSDGVVAEQTFIDQSLMRSRGKPVGTDAAKEGLIAGYGLGLGRRDRHGAVGYCHGGNIVGFVAMLCIFPGESKAFAYSVNTDSETADYGRLDALFIDTLGVADESPPPTADPVPEISEWHGRYVLSPNRFRMFEYLDTVFGAIAISPDGDDLSMASLQRAARRLRPVGERLYSANNRATASHVFFRGDNGEYLVGDGFRTYEKVPAAYLIAHWASVTAGLAGLAWILIAGSVCLARYRSGFLRRPEAPAYLAVLTLLVPVPFFLTQSFMALGDFTPASASLAAATLVLPIGMAVTLLLVAKAGRKPRINVVHGTAAALVLQWCAVLIAAGMLPFRLWA